MQQETPLTQADSIKLITEMINRTKQSFHETGFGPIMWGSIIMLCSLYTFFDLRYSLRWVGDVWILTLLAIVPQVIYDIKRNKKKLAKRTEDIMLSYVWGAFGISIFMLILWQNMLSAELVKGIPNYSNVRGTFSLFDHSTTPQLILYAIPTFITGGVMKFKPMLLGGILFWVFAIISIFTKLPADMLLLALGALCGWLIPGLILNATYRKATAATHV